MTNVPAADRTLRVFEAFERNMKPLTLSKLAEEIGVPISSCHNLVRTLISRGYLFSVESQRALYPTGKLWELASNIAAHDPLLERLIPSAERLRDNTSETVIIGKRQGDTAFYLLVLEGLHTIRYMAKPGEAKPLHTSAIGKALLSFLDNGKMESWLRSRRLEKVTSDSITDHSKLRKEIMTGKSRGYFATSGENVPDVGAVAFPVRVGDENLAIAVAGPVARMGGNRQSIICALKETVDELVQ